MAALYLRTRIPSLISLSASVLLAASMASAQIYKAPESDVAAKAKTPVPAVESSAVTPPAMRAFVDPVTGKLREPSVEEQQAMSRDIEKRLSSSTKPLTVQTTASGMRMIQLDDSFMDYSVITINADGTLSEACVTGPAAAEKLVNHPVTTETQKPEAQ